METKSKLTRALQNDGGMIEEIFALKLEISAMPDDKLSDVLAEIHAEVDKRFAQNVLYETRTMPLRLEEGRRWQQLKGFENLLTGNDDRKKSDGI